MAADALHVCFGAPVFGIGYIIKATLKSNCPFVHAAAAELAIERDPVDIMIRDALSPVVDPFIAYLYRTPATAQILRPLIGINTPLVSFLFSNIPATAFTF